MDEYFHGFLPLLWRELHPAASAVCHEGNREAFARLPPLDLEREGWKDSRENFHATSFEFGSVASNERFALWRTADRWLMKAIPLSWRHCVSAVTNRVAAGLNRALRADRCSPDTIALEPKALWCIRRTLDRNTAWRRRARRARDPFQTPVERMKILATPFTITKFDELPPSIAAGSTGSSLSRSATMGDLRVRVVEYAPGYLADHWCDRGHVFYLLRGEVTVELSDGRSFPMKAGESFQVSDDGDSPHRLRTAIGGTAFIVD